MGFLSSVNKSIKSNIKVLGLLIYIADQSEAQVTTWTVDWQLKQKTVLWD